MQSCDINLIRDRVPSPRRRRLLYWLLILYLLAAGGMLALAARISAQQIVDAGVNRRELQLLREAFRAETGSEEDVRSHAAMLRSRMDAAHETVRHLETLFQDRANMPRILLGLWTPLPPEFRIQHLSVRHASRELQFDLLVPADLPDSNQRISRLVRDWQDSPGLAAEVASIQIVSRQRDAGAGAVAFLQLKVVGSLHREGT